MIRKVNVLQVIERLNPGGAESLLLTFARNVNRERFNVIFCCLDDEGDMAGMIAKEGFRVLCLKVDRYRYYYKRLFYLARIIKNEKIDIVHTHLHRANYIGRLVAYLRGTMIICKSEHGYGGDYRSQNIIDRPRYMRRNMQLDHITDAIVYVSQAQLRNSGKRVNDSRKHVIHNGLDTERFEFREDRKVKRQALGFSDTDIVIGIVANMHRYKGHIYLLRALKKLLTTNPSTTLVAVGEGPEKAALIGAAKELDIEKRVMFLGWRGDVPELMRAFDFMVAPSLFESFGIALIEAMFSSLPVVATNVGGIPEVVKNGETGVLVPPADPDAIAGALLMLIENPKRAKTMGEKGRADVLSRFTGRRYARDMEKLYVSLMEERRH